MQVKNVRTGKVMFSCTAGHFGSLSNAATIAMYLMEQLHAGTPLDKIKQMKDHRFVLLTLVHEYLNHT